MAAVESVDIATSPAVFRRASFLARITPYATVFISSACIMVIELVAGRLVSRHIGQSLYTWTTIIGVILAGISLGNYAGGRLADIAWSRRALGLQFILAAVACLSIFFVNSFAGHLALLTQLPWPARIFLHILVTFIVPSAMLGTISPVIAKRALRTSTSTGRVIGGVYAWATAGSIVGTFLTGFYLLTIMGATTVAGGAAGILAAIGVLYLLGSLVREKDFSAAGEDAETPAAPSGSHSLFGPILTVFLANACVMLMEIVAGRLISRYYGQSLYSWTAVIGVILAGMALGSYVGGLLADRFRINKVLGYLLILGSLGCLAVSVVTKYFVHYQVLIGFSWPVQIQLHCLFALFLPSLLLGAVAPVVVKLALERGLGAGRTIGTIYAWGSVGSILGTFIAGYWMIAAIGSLLTLYVAACLLAIMGVVYGRAVKVAYAWMVVVAVALLVTVLPVVASDNNAFGKLVQRVPYIYYFSAEQTPAQDAIYTRESQYSFIAVLADSNEPNIRQMTLDHLIHSKIDMNKPADLQYEYEFTYEAVIDKYYPPPKPMTSMVIGGGGYAFPHYLELTRPGSHVEVAEIDPAVTEAAHAAFGLPRDTTINIYNMDARNRVDDLVRAKRAGEKVPLFDCIFGDSINDYSVPYHLTTLEFNRELSELLADDGMYLFNMIDMLKSGLFVGAVINTCRQTFAHVYVFSSHDKPDERDTFIVVASKRELTIDDVPDKVRERMPGYAGRTYSLENIEELTKRTGNQILTDDFAPVENLLAPVVRTSRVSVSYVQLATAAYAKEDYDQVIDLCNVALRVDRDSADAHELKGLALSMKKDLDGAIRELKRSIECDKDRPTSLDALANAYFRKGDYDDANQAWTSAIALNPVVSKPYEDFGGALLKWGRVDEAMDLLKKAVELDDNAMPAHVNLATAYYQKNDFPRAIMELSRVLEIDPKQPGIHPQLAMAYYRNKDYDNAWKHVDAATGAGEADKLDARFLNDLKRDSGRK